MNFIINISLNGITEHCINFIDEHAEISGFRIVAAQVRVTSFHAIVVGLLDLLWCSIWKLVKITNQLLENTNV